MPNSKKSIYNPTKGRNVSQKKLYKLPNHMNGQKGGGIMDSISSFLKGGEIPGEPAVDGEGNIESIDNDERKDSFETSDSKEEETPKEEETSKEEETPKEEETSKEEVISNSMEVETPMEEVISNSMEVETPKEEVISNSMEVETPKEEKGLFEGIGETVSKSLSDTTSEIKDYVTQPTTEESSNFDDDSVGMESESLTTLQIPSEDVLVENKELRNKVNELQDKIDQLQEEIKELLKSQLVVNNNSSSSGTMTPYNENTTFESPEHRENNMLPFSPSPIERTDSSNHNMDVGSFTPDSTMGENNTTREDETNTGGTKKYRKKQRKTKRKRNKKVTFQQ